MYFIETTIPGVPDVKTFYDILGRELRTETDGFSGTVTVDRTYNARGELTSGTYPRYASDPVKNITYTYNNDFGYLTTENNNGLNTTYGISGTTTTVTNPAGQTFTRTTDAIGAIISATDDAGGTVSYSYFSHGQPKTITAAGSTTTMEYDEYGRQTTLSDPSAGQTSYVYNAFGELVEQTDANGNTYTMQYDPLGRITSKIGTTEGTYSYQYVTSGNGLGNLKTTTAPNGNSTTYEYDKFARPTKLTETIDGQNFDMQYEYDNFGNLTKQIYPSGYTVQNTYNNIGYLTQSSGPQGTIFTSNEFNAMNQYTKYTLGNGIQTENTYNDFGLLSNSVSGTVQEVINFWDNATGNLLLRGDELKSRGDALIYDNLNRLQDYGVVGGPPPITLSNVSYASNGNITPAGRDLQSRPKSKGFVILSGSFSTFAFHHKCLLLMHAKRSNRELFQRKRLQRQHSN